MSFIFSSNDFVETFINFSSIKNFAKWQKVDYIIFGHDITVKTDASSYFGENFVVIVSIKEKLRLWFYDVAKGHRKGVLA